MTSSKRYWVIHALSRVSGLNSYVPEKDLSDTLKAKKKSWYRKNLYGQVYTTDFGWVGFYPMQTKSQVHETLVELAHDKGVPYKFVMDNLTLLVQIPILLRAIIQTFCLLTKTVTLQY